jgi:hypothetical protein
VHKFPVRSSVASFGAAVALLMTAAAPAGAATFGCSASAARITILGTNTLEPTTANVGAPSCRTASATLSDAVNGLNPAAALLKPISAQAVAASTVLTDGNGDPTKQAVQAVGGVAALKVGIDPTSAITIPQVSVPTQTPGGVPLNAIPVTLPASVTALAAPLLSGLGLSSGASSITVDATPALNALKPALRALPTLDLLSVRTAIATATASCQNGAPVVAGASNLAGIQVAGQDVSLDGLINQAVTVLPSLPDVNFAGADASNVTVPAFVTNLLQSNNILVTQAIKDALSSAVHDAVAAALATLAPVARPAVLANVVIKPGQTVRDGDSVTQQALLASISVAGTRIVDAVIGEAKASESGLDCSALTSPSTPTGATLQCSTRKLVLVDVLRDGNRVKLSGVADPKYIGKTVSIVFTATGTIVAHAVVARDGTFKTTAPLPAANIRDTNRARYTAKIGSERSLELKLARRMIVRFMHSQNGKVTIAGRVVPPLGTPVKPIVLTQRVSCGHDKVVGRFLPDRNGNFRISVVQPKTGTTAVYRLSTYVRPTAHSHHLAPTFTLPRAIELH